MALKEYQIQLVDADDQPLLNFPVATRYAGNASAKKNNKLTSDPDGILSFWSDGRSVEVFVLAPILADGKPNLSLAKDDQHNDPVYFRLGTLKLNSSLPKKMKSPYRLRDYGVTKMTFVFYENQQNNKKYTMPFQLRVNYLKGGKSNSSVFMKDVMLDVKNGEITIHSILNSRIQVQPMKNAKTAFKDLMGYTAQSTNPVSIFIYLDIANSGGTVSPPIATLPSESSELIQVNAFVSAFKADCSNFIMAEGTRCPPSVFNAQSELNLKDVCKAINAFFQNNQQYQANLYEIAYMLSTGFIEAYYYLKPVQLYSRVPEGGNKAYFNKYDIAYAPKKAKELGNLYKGDGYTFRGRGLVQLTGRANYRKLSTVVGKNLESQPDLACEFQYAVPIMIVGMKNGMFTGYKISDFINRTQMDYSRARRVINGSDKADIFAKNAKRIEELLKKTCPYLPQTF